MDLGGGVGKGQLSVAVQLKLGLLWGICMCTFDIYMVLKGAGVGRKGDRLQVLPIGQEVNGGLFICCSFPAVD